LKELIRQAPVHERKMEIRTYPLEDDRVIVEGWLRDERLLTGYHWDGRPRPSGVVHWMGVRLLIGDWPLTILEAEAEMPTVPHKLCPTVLESVKKLVGLSITSGYSNQVRRRLGGVKGCNHLTHLILAMGTAALHGFWTHLSRQPQPVPRSFEEIPGLPYLINSCKLWKEDGPFIQEIKEKFRDQNK
ncbi:MAG: hypothetical protein C0407_10990, partial [Desulfobacca sp.]|nr:hypothetical protein [Desulfobacca sp.]